MKISSFWVVTKPTKNSELGDICFHCTPQEFARQIKGGLQEDEIHSVYDNRSSAEEKAKWLIHRAKTTN